MLSLLNTAKLRSDILCDVALAIAELELAVVDDKDKKVASTSVTPVQKVPQQRIQVCMMHHLDKTVSL
jgi:hypothetical protein